MEPCSYFSKRAHKGPDHTIQYLNILTLIEPTVKIKHMFYFRWS
jgi:hypothetical protein